MARVKRGVTSKKRHKKVLKLTKGFRGRAKNCFRIALTRLEKSLQYAYRDRRNKKRDLRALWIQRINAAAREHGLKYSVLINLLNKSNISINRKQLAEMAVSEPESFKNLIASIKN
tara:strand:- start:376 stop:723 length:348 start_codon:yes stop_codon:yes gene_type:complete